MSGDAPTAPEAEAGSAGFIQRSLAAIERVGNKVPHPAIRFLALCIAVMVISGRGAWAGNRSEIVITQMLRGLAIRGIAVQA